jgi:tetratricopeptide (TPR) repeat protein
MSEYDRLAVLLRHHDPFVRSLVEYALWSISVRGGSSDQTRMLLQALRHTAAHRRAEALLLLNRLVVENPRFAEAFYQRALIYHTDGNYSAALQDCRRAVELNHNHYGAHAQMGHAHAQLDQYRRALDCYYAALRIHPNLEGLRENLRCLRRLLARREAGKTHA